MASINRRGFLKSAAALSAFPLFAGTEISVPKETLKFIHVTDSHMDLADSDSVEAMELMASHINRYNPGLDFVLFGGDNFNNNVPGSKDAERFKAIIDTLHCPSYVVRGNKESSPVPADDPIGPAVFREMFMHDKALTVSGNDWFFEKKGYAILGLDSNIEHANNGRYSEATMAFAESVLKQGKPTIILNHHPYTNYWKGTEAKDIHKYVLNNTEVAQERLFGYSNLILTLSGHKHIDNVGEIKGTKVIVTRGFVRPLDLDMFPMRYVELSQRKITEKLIYTS